MKIDAYQQLSFMADKASIGLESIIQNDKQNNLLNFGVIFCKSIIEIYKDKSIFIENNNIRSAILDDNNRKNELSKLGINDNNFIDSIKKIESDFELLISGEKEIVLSEIEELQDKIYWLSIYFYEHDITQIGFLKEKQSVNAYG